jgi:hypothetical protein
MQIHIHTHTYSLERSAWELHTNYTWRRRRRRRRRRRSSRRRRRRRSREEVKNQLTFCESKYT